MRFDLLSKWLTGDEMGIFCISEVNQPYGWAMHYAKNASMLSSDPRGRVMLMHATAIAVSTWKVAKSAPHYVCIVFAYDVW